MTINSQILSKEQVLIVGCGDIGARLAKYVAETGAAVTGLRRHPPQDTAYLHYHAGDVSHPVTFRELLPRKFDVIVVSMTPAERSDAGYQQAYVNTCQQLVDGLRELSLKPRLLVFVSSTAVYGQMDGSWVNEDSPTEPDTFSGKRLIEAENIILNSEFPSTIVRFSGIYGPGRNRLIEQVRQGRASASEHFTNRIHADDCAGSIAYIIEKSRLGMPLETCYLATDSSPAPMIEVVTWLATQLRVDEYLSDTASNERGNKRCSNARLLNMGFCLKYPSYKEGYLPLLQS